MKKLGISIFMALFFCAFLFVNNCSAQNYNQPCNSCDQKEMAFEKYNSKKEMVGKTTLRLPEYSGGMDSLYLYLAENLKYPEALKSSKVEGTTLVQFIVGIDGEVSEVTVAQSSGYPEMDEEAVRVVKSSPKWTPGKQRDRAVKVTYTFPVIFELR